ncbi:155_t:CDS:1 [Ambispora leptoticha]|uniref:155_t:CDS:1 n=1 Tax=Ambispora leptoticha TaxID=144679 RepID=A0A9N9G3M1_9GLOM|nr:155_t:CDS:1 [Ambispora leptoticha]
MPKSKNYNPEFDTIILQEIVVPSPYSSNDRNVDNTLKIFNQSNEIARIAKPKISPNCFNLYKHAFARALAEKNIHRPAKVIAKMASKKWETESHALKRDYEQKANEISRNMPKYADASSSLKKESKKELKWRNYDYADIARLSSKKSSSSNQNCELINTSNDNTEQSSSTQQSFSKSFLLTDKIPSINIRQEPVLSTFKSAETDLVYFDEGLLMQESAETDLIHFDEELLTQESAETDLIHFDISSNSFYYINAKLFRILKYGYGYNFMLNYLPN